MKSSNLKQSIYFMAVIGLLIFLHFTKILLPLESLTARIFNPILGGFYSLGSRLRLAYQEQAEKGNLNDLLKEKENQTNQLITENAKLKILEEENKILRRHLNFLSTEKRRYLMASIVSRTELNGLSQTIIIDKGSSEGLITGLPLVSGEGIVVGKIISTKEHLAEACLTTNSRCQLAAAIQSQDGTSGIARGELNLIIKMEFIPQTKEIKTGDMVVTSGLEQNIPRGLVIGRIKEVNKESNELWQGAAIEPLVQPDELVIISVLLPN